MLYFTFTLLLSPFLAHQPSENHRLIIQICITSSLESTPGFIPSASPVMSRLTSSSSCQLISVIITTLIIHHSFTPGSKPTFSTNPLPTLDSFDARLLSRSQQRNGRDNASRLNCSSFCLFNFSVCPVWWTNLATCQLFTERSRAVD